MNVAPVLVLGARGMLGRALVELLHASDVEHVGVDVDDVDVTDPAAVARVLEPRFGTVVNCAAYTDVDGAEADEARAHAVNADAVGHVARRAAAVEAFLVHFSTDYVFDGRGLRPHAVDDPQAPAGVYARTKAAGERQLKESGAPHLLVRTSWLYAPWGKNFVLTIARAARERDVLRVVDDQRGRPTDARHLARATWALRARGSSGTFHVTDGGQCTWFELARFIAASVAPRCRVEPITTAELARPAPRPAYSVLDLEKTEAVLGPMPSWESSVRATLRDAGLLP